VQDFTNGRHSGGGLNIAFADGHVKFVKTEVAVMNAEFYKAGQPSAWEPGKPN
jgi:prepilin-type processing-associated H-X9-DG protein